MTDTHIQLLDDLGAEFARLQADRPRARQGRLLRPVAIAFSALVLLGAGAYTVPPTRAAIDDLASTFGDWVGVAESEPPGRALRPDDDAPEWVRESGGRVIVEKQGVGLYLTRVETVNGTVLNFALGESVGIGNTVEGWREEFEDRAARVLGPAHFKNGDMLDEQGRYPLLGLSARSVESVELRYESGAPLVEEGLDGGFILIADAWRKPRELVAYDVAGRELDRVDLGYLDVRYFCEREPGCPG